MRMQAFVIMFGIILAFQTATFFLVIRVYNKFYGILEELLNKIAPKNVLRKGAK
jgi:hypothetical protein